MEEYTTPIDFYTQPDSQIDANSESGENENVNNLNEYPSSTLVSTTNEDNVETDLKDVKERPTCSQASTNSDLDLRDIYDDIETVSTSKPIEEPILYETSLNLLSDDDDSMSENDLVIDTTEENLLEAEENEAVTSTTNNIPTSMTNSISIPITPLSSQGSVQDNCEPECPNFSIYSKESKQLAKDTDLQLLNEEILLNQNALAGCCLGLSRKPENVGLYSDSDEDIVKIVKTKNFPINDIRNLTEDISEEERSYTPCLDERISFKPKEDFESWETISDEGKNDFDEVKTALDGDALEINAKENELDFSRTEDYEEGEIIDKLKNKLAKEKEKEKEDEENKDSSFKKLSKSNKERHYREKRSGSESDAKNKENDDRSKRKDRKKGKRKDMERYNVRNIVTEKPRREKKDKFGRDARRRSSSSSASPGLYTRRSYSRSRKRSGSRKRSPSRKRRRSDKNVASPSKKRVSHKRSKTPPTRISSPSWTPPRLIDNQTIKPHNLKVILTNDSKATKKKRSKNEKRNKFGDGGKVKKRKRDNTPPPNKEVFASGDNILVSVSYNKDNEVRERETTVKRSNRDESSKNVSRKEIIQNTPAIQVKQTRKKIPDLSSVKPVAIIDLDRSPFKELTPSPKDIIVLSDSDNGDTPNANESDLNQSQGPKTPPEPQVKFLLQPKAQQIRAITNPLQEVDDDGDSSNQAQQQTQEAVKGPNTPPEPPTSPGSCSPDAYDPFDPTKSPENVQMQTQEDENHNLDVGDDGGDGDDESQAQETLQMHTPPMEIQQADSQTTTTSESSVKTPEVSTENQTASMNTATTTTLSASSVLAVLLPNPTKSLFKPVTKLPVKPTPNLNKKKSNSNNSNDSNMDLDSPYSPGPSDYEDLFEPPTQMNDIIFGSNKVKTTKTSAMKSFDQLFGSSSPPNSSVLKMNKGNGKLMLDKKKKSGLGIGSASTPTNKGTKLVNVKADEDNLRIIDDLPNSAVEMHVKDKFLKKLNRQERVVEEVKLVLKPHYNKKHINKEEYKDILRRAVPKICHSKSGEINPKKIQNLIEAYVKKFRHNKKVTSSSSINNTQK